MLRSALFIVALVAGVAFTAKLAALALNPPVAVGDIPEHGWTVAWLLWFVVVIGGFFAIEIPAVLNDHGGDTLTEHIEYIAGQSPVWVITVAGGILAFFLWFASHLFSEDSRVWEYVRGRVPGEPLDEIVQGS